MLFANTPIKVPVLIPTKEPVGPRCFAPIAPKTPVAIVVAPNVKADFPASSKKFLPFETSWATCAASIPPRAIVPSFVVRVNALAVISLKGLFVSKVFAYANFLQLLFESIS